jgi:hypothetical protein
MRIIEETLAPGAVVTEIARRHGIATSLVFTWRRRARLVTVASAGPRLVPVQVTAAYRGGIQSPIAGSSPFTGSGQTESATASWRFQIRCPNRKGN